MSERVPGISFSCNSRVDTLDLEVAQALRKAGCVRVTLGVESGSQRVLDYLKKGIRKEQVVDAVGVLKEVGIDPYLYFMINTPVETYDTLKETEDFIDELGVDEVEVSMLTPLPGTELWDTYLQQGGEEKEWYKYFMAGVGQMKGPIPEDELFREYVRIYNKTRKRALFCDIKRRVRKWIGG